MEMEKISMEFMSYKEKVLSVAKNAFERIINGKFKEIKEIREDKENEKSLIFEFARYGENYFQNDGVRLMVVGRAAGKFKRPKVGLAVIKQGSNGINISEEQIEKCFNEYHYEEKALSWIHKKEADDKFYLDSKPFFGFSKKIYLELSKEGENPEWFKNICYTNLCKIISTEGGNPSEKLIHAQMKRDMLELLKIEIDYYRPTHILVLDSATEEHSWSTKEFKEEMRAYVSEQEPGIKICFSNRPEYRGNNELMKQEELIELMEEV